MPIQPPHRLFGAIDEPSVQIVLDVVDRHVGAVQPRYEHDQEQETYVIKAMTTAATIPCRTGD